MEVSRADHRVPSGNNFTGNSSAKPRHYRAIFLSDTHLGTKDCKAKELCHFLKRHSCDQLYLVGDIFDGWKMKSGVHWNKHFNRVIRHILKYAKNDTSVHYITGNHDEFLRRYANMVFDKIQLVNRVVHTTVNGKRYLVIHGDQFEGVTRCSRGLKFLGDHGYRFLMTLNRAYNLIRRWRGLDYWSFAAFLKTHVQRARVYITDYEHAVAAGAKRQGFDGVVCGHIHHAQMCTIDGIEYLNTGDWVESCTAIAETTDGEFELIHWLQSPEHLLKKAIKPKKRLAKHLSTTT